MTPEPLDYQSPATAPPLRPWWIVVASTMVFVALGFAAYVVVLIGLYQSPLLMISLGLFVVGIAMLELSVIREFDPSNARVIGWISGIFAGLFLFSFFTVVVQDLQSLVRSRTIEELAPRLVTGAIAACTTFISVAHFAFARRIQRIAYERPWSG